MSRILTHQQSIITIKRILLSSQVIPVLIVFLFSAEFLVGAVNNGNQLYLDPELVNITVKGVEKNPVGEQIKITYLLSYPEKIDAANVKLDVTVNDVVSGFKLAYINSSLSMSTTNGKTSYRTDISWIYTALAVKKGRFETISCNVMAQDTITIVPVDINPIYIVEQRDTVAAETDEQQDVEIFPSMPVVVVAEIDKPVICLGDSIVYTVTAFGNDLKTIALDGAFAIDDCFYVSSNSEAEAKSAEYDGIPCYRYLFMKYVVTPLRKGKFEIPALRFNGTQNIKTGTEKTAFWEIPQYKEIPFETSTDKITFTVK